MKPDQQSTNDATTSSDEASQHPPLIDPQSPPSGRETPGNHEVNAEGESNSETPDPDPDPETEKKNGATKVRCAIPFSKTRIEAVAKLSRLPEGLNEDALRSILRATISKMSNKDAADLIDKYMTRKSRRSASGSPQNTQNGQDTE